MSERREPDQTNRRHDDEQALEEIRQLFARYRRIARHGVVAERDERPPVRTVALTARVRHSRDAPAP
jgi:hypothetical protein